MAEKKQPRGKKTQAAGPPPPRPLTRRKARVGAAVARKKVATSAVHETVIFRGNNLRIRGLTPATRDILNLTPGDVDRSVPELTLRIECEDMATDVLDVLKDCVAADHAVRTQDGNWYIMRVLPGCNVFKVVDGVAVTFVDVTQLKRTEEALRESEQRLRAIVDTAVDAIITIDERGIIETFNPAAERLLGYPAKDAIGQNVKLLMPSPYRDGHDDYVRHYLETGEKKVIGIGREVVGRRKDGSTFPADLAVSEMSLNGRRMFTGVLRDITQRKQAEEALRKAHEGLEARVRERTASLSEANQRLEKEVAERKRLEEEARRHETALAHVGRVAVMGELVSSLAHGLNQPLCAMLSNAQAAQRLAESNPRNLRKLQPVLRDIVEDCQQAAGVLDHVRAFLRKGQAERSLLQVNTVITAIAHILKVDAHDHGATIRFSLGEPLPPVLGDPIQLQQVVLNLARNGFEAMAELGPREHEVLVSTATDNGAVQVAVRDRGAGLSDEAIASLFEPFFTTKPQGLGMGLAISRSIIESHGGRLWAEPNPDCGTAFHFTLPAFTEGERA